MGEAWQSHAMESVGWRLPRHFVPRNDELIGASLVNNELHTCEDSCPVLVIERSFIKGNGPDRRIRSGLFLRSAATRRKPGQQV